MRNEYPGDCADCGAFVGVGCGHFQRWNGRWIVRCLACVQRGRYEKAKRDAARDALRAGGFAWIEGTIVLAVLAIILAVALPWFFGDNPQTPPTAENRETPPGWTRLAVPGGWIYVSKWYNADGLNYSSVFVPSPAIPLAEKETTK